MIPKFLIWGLLLIASSAQGVPPAVDALQQIPKEDRICLRDFFKGLVGQGSFAMTLFGQKAATCFDYPPHLLLRMNDQTLQTRFILELKGWRIWEKYKDLFNIKNYIFINLPYEYPSILFVHKEKTHSVLTEHNDFFRNYFSKDPLTEKIDHFLMNAFVRNFHIHNFHIVQGLLLGYQWESCLDFQERLRIEDTLAYFPYDVDEEFMGCSAAPESLLDGYPENLMKKQLQFKENFSIKHNWPATNPFFCTSSPGYMAFHIPYDPSVHEIKQKIAQLYNSEQFLEDFIEMLTQ